MSKSSANVRANTARLAVVHPYGDSKIERLSGELVALREQIKQLEAQKSELSTKLLRLVQAEGEADAEGKVRYETELHKFIIIQGKNVTVSGTKTLQALVAAGVKARIAKMAVAKGTSTTEYEYVRVDEKKAEENG